MKIMASGPITSWEIDGETVETVSDFIQIYTLYTYTFDKLFLNILTSLLYFLFIPQNNPVK